MKRIILFQCALLFSAFAFSQNLKYCGTTEATEKYLREHPEEAAQIAKNQAELELHSHDPIPSNKQAAVTYYIPVVFHILHQYGPENISDAQVLDAVRIMNEDFQKLNPDISQVVTQFQGISSDTQIGFRLARKDPSGNCTNGIDRIVTAETMIGDDGSKLNGWPNNKYLNIWVAGTISNGAAGYSFLPGTTSNSNDGIMILSTYVGSIGTGNPVTSRALTHEVGHYLNLQHPWGSSNNPGITCGNDNVTDTPVTKGWTSCNLSGAVCNTSILENVQNFMEYSYCTRMYTTGQKTRMTNALNSFVSGRNNLWKSNNLLATGTDGATYAVCTPKADFVSDVNTVCTGGTVQFTDLSWNGHPTSWLWTFPGGTPSTSTDSTPSVQYTTSGIHSVTLKATNITGTNTVTKTSYINALSNIAKYNTWFYSEGYEGSSIPNADWSIINSDNGVTWASTTTAASSGTKSVKLSNTTNGNDLTTDELVGPTFDVSAITSPTFTFKVAYVQKSSATLDKLNVYLSADCGQSWTIRYTKAGPALATAPIQTAAFTPNSTQWRMETLSLSGFTSATNVMCKFKFTANLGNNVYIDDINVQGPNSLGAEIGQSFNFNVFPNPAEASTVVSFSLLQRQQVRLTMYDVLGKEIVLVENTTLNEGEHSYTLNKTQDLAPGIYIVRLNTGEQFVTRKLVIR